MTGDLASHHYARPEVRRLLKVTERQLRSWEKQDLIPAQQTYGFKDLVALRSLAQLRRNKVSTTKIRKAIAALRDKLDHVENPLVELKLFSDGRNVRVVVGGQTMEPVSGQLLLGFEQEELQRLVSFPEADEADLGPLQEAKQRDLAERLFQRALELEQVGSPVEAIQIYRQVLELDPKFAGALVNLGTMFFTARDLERAEEYYSEAIEADPTYPLAHFNLGNLHDELGNRAAALAEYQIALRLQPNYADAHYNIALLYQGNGQLLTAVKHWKTYIKLDPTSPWATIARRELNKLYRETVVETDRRRR